MLRSLQTGSQKLLSFVDWFIPAGKASNSDVLQSVRMFLFSHLFGPFLGHTISLYILFVTGQPDFAWWVFFVAITLFWPFTIVLRITGAYVPLALVSIENLMFCILWGCYHYGGISSPILPWLITVPLLAFFYLPTARTRILVSCLIVINLLAFYYIYSSQGFPETIPLSKLVGLGIVSTFCAGMYVSMMALYYASIVSSQSDLEQEVRRHQETEKELRRATEQVERATRAKSEFLAKMSHELRNPLNAIIGYSEMMLEETDANDQKCTDLRSIKAAGCKLLELVNDLLDLSKLEAGKMELDARRFPLKELFDDLVAKWEGAIAANGNEFHVEDAAVLGEIYGDAGKLRQVISNLLSNASKYTKNGNVSLSARDEGGVITIAVRDTGTGIDPQQMGNLFDTFSGREDETASNYGEDPGLGLPLSQRLCRLMGGDLTVDSEVGRGSTFTIRIPSNVVGAGNQDEPARSTVPDPAAPDVIDGGASWADGGAAGADEIAETPDREGPAGLKRRIASLGRPLRVLIADDDEANRVVAAKMLKEFAMEIAMARDGAEAVEAVKRMSFDLLLMDMRMPSMDGITATKAIRGLGGERATVPIIAFTGNGFVEDVTACLQAGMNDFIVKPVRKKVLVNAVSRVLSGNEAMATDPVSGEAGAVPIEQSAGSGSDMMFDRVVFDGLVDVVGLADAHNIAQVFVEEAETRLRRLGSLSTDSDRDVIEREAHAVKSGAAIVGLLHVAQLAETIERKAPVIEPTDYSVVLERLATAFALSRVHLPKPPTMIAGCDRAIKGEVAVR